MKKESVASSYDNAATTSRFAQIVLIAAQWFGLTFDGELIAIA
jgi:hypothetical protein